MKSSNIWINRVSLVVFVLLVLWLTNLKPERPYKPFVFKKNGDSLILKAIKKSFPRKTKAGDTGFYSGYDTTISERKPIFLDSFKDGQIPPDTNSNRPTSVYLGSKRYSECRIIGNTDQLSDNFFFSDFEMHGEFTLVDPERDFDSFSLDDIEFYGRSVISLEHALSSIDLQGIRCDDKMYFHSRDSLKKSLSFHDVYFENGLAFNNKYRFGRNAAREVKRGIVQHQRVKGLLLFGDCKFHGTLDLSGMNFLAGSQLKIYESRLPDTLDMTGTIADKLDLTNFSADSGKICYLMLGSSSIGNLNFEYNNYKLVIPQDFNKDEVTNLYQKVLKYFKDNGYDDSYEKLDIEYREHLVRMDDIKANAAFFVFLDKHSGPEFSAYVRNLCNYYRLPVVLDRINRVWWNYGYNRLWVVYWSVFIVLIFSIYNSFRYQELQAVLYVEKLDVTKLPYIPNRWKAAAARYWYCLIYTGFVFFKINFDFKNMNFNSKYMVTLLFQYLVGLVCTAFIINLILGK